MHAFPGLTWLMHWRNTTMPDGCWLDGGSLSRGFLIWFVPAVNNSLREEPVTYVFGCVAFSELWWLASDHIKIMELKHGFDFKWGIYTSWGVVSNRHSCILLPGKIIAGLSLSPRIPCGLTLESSWPFSSESSLYFNLVLCETWWPSYCKNLTWGLTNAS